MGSRTIMVTDAAYERLKAAKREGESFTDVIERLLEGEQPRLVDFASLFDKKTADEIAKSVEAIRAQELQFARAKLRKGRRSAGRDA